MNILLQLWSTEAGWQAFFELLPTVSSQISKAILVPWFLLILLESWIWLFLSIFVLIDTINNFSVFTKICKVLHTVSDHYLLDQVQISDKNWGICPSPEDSISTTKKIIKVTRQRILCSDWGQTEADLKTTQKDEDLEF